MSATTALPRQLTVDLWSDIACPFCWIGERRLDAALTGLATEWPEVRVARRWRPFQLQPDLPRPGVAWADFARAKFGGEAAMAQAFGHVARMGAEDGLDYRFDRIAAAPNTADAHRLILHAEAADPGGTSGARLAEALFRAYFHEGRHVGERPVLLELATEQGLDPAGVARVLDGPAYAADVEASQAEAARLGIRGVPFVVLGGRYAVSGAQPTDVFGRALAAALEAPV
jgi:predicted DsbA family dithiol-disulfide isomerase